MARVIFLSLYIYIVFSCTPFYNISEYNNVIVKNGKTFFYNDKARIRIRYFGDYDFKNDLLQKYDSLFIRILNNMLEIKTIKRKNILSIAETNVDPIWQSSILLLEKEDLSIDNLLSTTKFSLMKENELVYYEKFGTYLNTNVAIRIYEDNNQWIILFFSSTNKDIFFSFYEYQFISNSILFGTEYLKNENDLK